jgi:membrane protein YdbS with pleckstrin-like domain
MDQIVQKATFSSAVRTYILLVPCFFMLISVVGIPLILIWFLGPGWMISRRYYDGLSCELTTSKLKFSKGVLVRVDKTIPLENIQDLTFIEGPILKAFGLSVLKVETAGSSGPHSANMRLIGIDDAREFRNLVLDQRDKLKENNNQPQGQMSNQDMLEVMREIRDVLTDIKKQGER